MPAPSYQTLTSMTDEQIIAAIDQEFQSSHGGWERKAACGIYAQMYFNELFQRNQRLNSDTMLGLTKTMLELNRDMHRLTKTSRNLVAVSIVIALVAAVFTAIAVFRH
jgi:hypothetical protein